MLCFSWHAMDFKPSGKMLSFSAADFHFVSASVYWRLSSKLSPPPFALRQQFLYILEEGEMASGVELNGCQVKAPLTLCASHRHDPIVRPHSPPSLAILSPPELSKELNCGGGGSGGLLRVLNHKGLWDRTLGAIVLQMFKTGLPWDSRVGSELHMYYSNLNLPSRVLYYNKH